MPVRGRPHTRARAPAQGQGRRGSGGGSDTGMGAVRAQARGGRRMQFRCWCRNARVRPPAQGWWLRRERGAGVACSSCTGTVGRVCGLWREDGLLHGDGGSGPSTGAAFGTGAVGRERRSRTVGERKKKHREKNKTNLYIFVTNYWHWW